MSAGEYLSLAINIGVGLYFARIYPRYVQRRFAGGRLPPFFAVLAAVLRPVGWMLIAGSIAYAAYRLASA